MSFLYDYHNETDDETLYTGHMRYDYIHIIFELIIFYAFTNTTK